MFAALALATAALVVACDDGGNTDPTDDRSPAVVDGVDDRPGDDSATDGSMSDDAVTDGTATPFDREDTPEVDSPTNELENQGFETEDLPGPVGNAQSPSD